MAVKLHRCSNHWAKLSGHPCWKVEKALNEMGVQFEPVLGPVRRGKRDALESLSGQRQYPVIEFEDGSIYREQSRDMERTIRDGKLMERAGAAASGGTASGDPDAEASG
jgi:glutaredoxin